MYTPNSTMSHLIYSVSQQLDICLLKMQGQISFILVAWLFFLELNQHIKNQIKKCDTIGDGLTKRLPGGVVDLQVERLCVSSLHHSHIATRPLVCFGQSVGSPVGPVHLPPVHGNCEWVGQILVSPQHLDQA